MKNKKFLLTIAMIMSLVMAISCGDTPTDSTGGNGNGGQGGGSGAGTPTQITKQQIESALAQLGTVSASNPKADFNFTSPTLQASGITYTITVTDNNAQASVKKMDIFNALKLAVGKVNSNEVTLTLEGTDLTDISSPAKSKTATIKIEAKTGYTLGDLPKSIVITFTVGGSGTWA